MPFLYNLKMLLCGITKQHFCRHTITLCRHMLTFCYSKSTVCAIKQASYQPMCLGDLAPGTTQGCSCRPCRYSIDRELLGPRLTNLLWAGASFPRRRAPRAYVPGGAATPRRVPTSRAALRHSELPKVLVSSEALADPASRRSVMRALPWSAAP